MTNIKNIKFPLLFDGAMGTYYPDVSKAPLPKVEMANIFDKDVILQIHKAYIKAGANAIKTNTFQANKKSLSEDSQVVEKVIMEGVKLAKEAAGEENILIFASIGPIANPNEANLEDYIEIVDVFLNEGIENFLFETFSSTKYLEEISYYIKSKSKNSFIITSFAIDAEGQSALGEIGSNLLAELAEVEDIDSVGLNCSSGPLHMREYLEQINLPEKIMTIMPNAGYPTIINGRTFYSDNKEYFANSALRFLDYGVKIIGGCCGTSPDFIEEISKKLPHYSYKEVEKKKTRVLRVDTPYSENLFHTKVVNGKRPISVEYDPPMDLDMDSYIENVKRLDKVGADAITIADCPTGRVRVDASLTAYKIKNEVGIDPVVHMTCRDRNLNATKALLLGLNIENILNVIVITGDPVPSADREEVKSVFNFNAMKLAAFVDDMNINTFNNQMNIGAALNVNAKRFDLELERALKKEDSGVRIHYTQPVISDKAVENIKIAQETLSGYLMGGIMPVVSYKNASFLDSEISGISVQDDIIQMYKEADEMEYDKLALEISVHYSKEIQSFVDGYYLITPFDRVDIMEKLIERIKAF